MNDIHPILLWCGHFKFYCFLKDCESAIKVCVINVFRNQSGAKVLVIQRKLSEMIDSIDKLRLRLFLNGESISDSTFMSE